MQHVLGCCSRACLRFFSLPSPLLLFCPPSFLLPPPTLLPLCFLSATPLLFYLPSFLLPASALLLPAPPFVSSAARRCAWLFFLRSNPHQSRCAWFLFLRWSPCQSPSPPTSCAWLLVLLSNPGQSWGLLRGESGFIALFDYSLFGSPLLRVSGKLVC